MSTTPTHLQAMADDLSRSEAFLTSDSPPVIALVPDTSVESSNMEGLNSELNQTPATTDHSSSRLLSIPAPSVRNHRSSLTLSDNADNASAVDPLSSEITSADITVARKYPIARVRRSLLINAPPADGSFVETSSGLAARELKRHWDQQVGVGKDVRSPYAITAFVNQHGKSMFRVGCVLLGYSRKE
jgi:GDP/GTP exchange factor required for growth at low temperature